MLLSPASRAGRKRSTATGTGSSAASSAQGRLTLTTLTPVLTSTVSAATTIYYTPYVGRLVPLWTGTSFAMADVGGELFQTTTDTTKSPAACAANSNYDFFVWLDGTTYRCTRGPAWTSDAARGTGVGTSELLILQGINVNKIAITNGPSANKGTYVGTIRTNAASQVDFIYGASGVAAFIGVWNMYNRVSLGTILNEGTANWVYASATVRALNASAIARISVVRGFNEDAVDLFIQTYIDTVGAGTSAIFGIGLDSITTFQTRMQAGGPGVGGIGSYSWRGLPGLGFHFIQQLEVVGNAASYTAYGTSNLSVFSAGFRC